MRRVAEGLPPAQQRSDAPPGPSRGVQASPARRAGDERAVPRPDGRDEMLRLVTDHAADIVGLLDAEGRYLYVSPAIERILGHPPSFYIGRHALEFLHPEDAAWGATELQKAFAGGVANGVLRTRHADGTWRWVEGSATQTKTGDGTVRIVTVGRDVTARVEADRARREAEERLRALLSERQSAEARLALYREVFRVSNDAIAMIDPEGRYLEQNAAHRALTGYGDEDLRGQTPALHLGEAAFAAIAAALAEKGRWRGEVVSRTKAGEAIPVELSAFSVLDDDGRVVCHVGIKRDMRGLKRTEAMLQHRLAQLEAIYELSAATGRAERAEEVQEAALQALSRTLGTSRAAVLLADAQGVLRFAAWRGLSDAYRAAVEGHSPWPPDAKDPRPVLVRDAFQEPSLAPYRALFEAEGIRALAFFPVVHQGRLLGKLMVYHRAPHAFPRDEVHVAQTVADHVAAAVARQLTHREVARSQADLQDFVENASIGIHSVDADGVVRWANRAELEMLGYARHEYVGRNIVEFHADPAAGEDILACLRQGEALRDREATLRCKDGSVKHVLISSSVRWEDGRFSYTRCFTRDVTDQKLAERRLRESLQLLSGVLEGTTDPVVVKDRAGRIVLINSAGAAVLGRPADAVVGRTVRDLFPEALAEQILAGDEEVLRTGRVVVSENAVPLAAGGTRTFLTSRAPLRDAGGGTAGVIGVSRDITDRKRAEEELRASEQRLQRQNDALVELATGQGAQGDFRATLKAVTEVAARTVGVERASVWWFDEAGAVLRCLDAHERGDGAHTDGAVLRAADYPAYFRALAEARTIAAEDANADARTAEFGPAYFGAHGIAAMLDAPVRYQGRVVGVVCLEHLGARRRWTPDEQQFAAAMADLVSLAHAAAERARAEEERVGLLERLQARTRQQAAVAELGALALSSRDLTAVLQQACERVSAVLGHDMTRVIELVPGGGELRFVAGVGWPPDLVQRPVPAGADSQAGFTLVSQGAVVMEDAATEARFHLSGDYVANGAVSGMSVPVRGRDGPWGVLSTHARRRRSYTPDDVNFLEAVANVLASAIERRRAEDELRRANEQLQDMDRMRTQFLNTVAHELRTPLTPIALQLEILRDAPLGEKHKRNIAILDRNMSRLTLLVEDILDVARLQAGRLPLHRTPVPFDRLVGDVVETFQEPARRGGVALSFRGGGVGTVEVDARRVGQVMFNLVSNALKFTPEGGRVEVETARDGDLARVRVADTGAGLGPEQMARLFRPFTQLHDEHEHGQAGSGLGLYISRGIVEQHGGSIWAESDGPGKGAAFTFTLPLAPPQAGPAEAPS